MKKALLLFSVFALTCRVAVAQIPGKKTTDPVTIGGVELKVGDTLQLGIGSAPYGSFKYIYQPPNYLASVGQQDLPSNFNRRKLAIQHFKVQTSKKFGEKTWVVVSPAVYNYAIDWEPAIASGEIVGVNGRQLLSAKNPTGQPVASVADELLKLKQLLDAGAINQTEYDQQKKKLLGQ